MESRSGGHFWGARAFVAAVALSHGLLDVVGLSNFLTAKERLGLPPEKIQLFLGIVALPWAVKPIFGFGLDKATSMLGAVRPIVFFTTLSTSIALILLALRPPILGFYALLFMLTCSKIVENILCEAILLRETKNSADEPNSQRRNQLPVYFGFRAAGGLVGAFMGGRLIRRFGLETPYRLATAAPALGFLATLFYSEPEGHLRRNFDLRGEVDRLRKLFTGPEFSKLATVLVLANLNPSFDALYTFFFTDRLSFNAEVLANLSSFATVCILLAILLYYFALQNLDVRNLFLTVFSLQAAVIVFFWLFVAGILRGSGVPDFVFCLFTQGFNSLLGELLILPIFALWSSLTPSGLEATSITAVTGLNNLSSGLSAYFGSLLIWGFKMKKNDFENLWISCFIQLAYALALICFFFFLPRLFNVGRRDPSSERLKPTNELLDVDQIL